MLHDKGNYYKNRIGEPPEFDASFRKGRVTAAEVGELKKELSCHGKVLNTAARNQGKRNEFNNKLLISEEMKDALGDTGEFNFTLIGNIMLKGKANPVNIFKVEPAGT